MSENKKSFLSKELKVGKDSYPTKQTMNFIVDKEATMNKISIVAFVIFLLILALFTKFGVIDTLSKTNDLQSKYNSYQSSVDSLTNELQDYSEVEEKYNAMVGSYLNEEEASSVNQADIVDLIDEDIVPYVEVTNYTIEGNNVIVYTGVTDLNTVSSILSRLQNDDRTDYVTISRTLADSTDTNKVTADIEITYLGAEGSN